MTNNPGYTMTIAVLILAVAFSLTACAKRPKLTDGGKKVQFVKQVEIIQDKLDDPKKCRFLAHIEVEASVTIGLHSSRGKEEQKRRVTRARNLAAKNGANVIITAGELTDKAQKFKAYKCNWTG